MHSDFYVQDAGRELRYVFPGSLKMSSLKLWLTVKCTILLVTVFCLQVAARGFSQQVSLSVKKQSLEKVINTIGKQSGYAFFYDASLLKETTPVTVNVRNMPVETLLPILFEGQPISYEINEKTIILRPKPKRVTNALPLVVQPEAGRSISGTVRDSDGASLPGVSILINGTQTGTTTNGQGYYLLENVDEAAVLRFSMIGFEAIELPVKGRNQLDVTMKEVTSKLGEVAIVSTGYQDIPKERATGSFVQVDNELFNRRVSPNVLDRLEGVTSGLNFNRSSMSESTISIRGQSTIYANATPLIVLDGFAYDGDLNSINPNDVQSITILKDAAAASIWGVRAGNGVIVITSKSGTLKSKMNLEFSSNITVGAKPDPYYLPKLSSRSFIDVERTLFENGFYRSYELNTVSRPSLSPVVETLILERDGGISASEAEARISSFSSVDSRADFVKYYLRNSTNQQYNLNARGGTDKAKYFVSAGLDKNHEVLDRNSQRRITIRSDNTFYPLKRMEVTTGVMLVSSVKTSNNPGLTVINQQSGATKSLYPYAKFADANGVALPVTFQFRETFLEGAVNKGLLDWQYRPLDELSLANNSANELYVRFNAGLSYGIGKFLSLNARYQLESSNQNRKVIYDQDSYYTRNLINQFTIVDANGGISRPIPTGAIRDDVSGKLSSSTLRVQGTFDRGFASGKHALSVLGGSEIKEIQYDAFSARLYGYDDDIITSQLVDYSSLYKMYYSTSTLTQRIPNNNRVTAATLNRFISYYSNAAYTFKEKYTLSLSGRMDASNFFGVETNQRMVPLWSSGISWNIHNERFFEKIGWLDKLILRTTHGVSGNIDKSVTAYTTTTRANDTYTSLPRAAIVNPPNPALSWERIALTNIGLDFSSRHNIVSGTIEWYHKVGKDLLGFQALDPTAGLSSYKGNVASMTGQGVDITLRSRNINSGNLKWETTLLLSYSKDKVTKLNMGTIRALALVQQVATTSGNSVSIVPSPGNAVYGLYSYRSAGLDPDNGNPRGYLNNEVSTNYSGISSSAEVSDLIYHGSSRPTHFGSFNNSISLKNVTVSANITYKAGYWFRRSSVNYQGLFINFEGHEDFDRRWQQAGDERFTSVPSMPTSINQNRDNFYLYSEDLVENGSHIRFQDIRISYGLPLTGRFKRIKGVDVYLYANNLGIIWRANKYGIDPDYIPNVNSLYLPQPKSISVGLKVMM